MTAFTGRVLTVIRSIPRGRVMTYGGVAGAAGSPRAARGVVWILHSSSDSAGLPWHRVVGAGGRISLPPGQGGELQRAMLESEGIGVGPRGRVDLARFGIDRRARRETAGDGIDNHAERAYDTGSGGD